MKILMIGLDGVAPTQWLGDKNLPHWQWLMEIGCYGKLEDAIQSGTAAARAIGDELERAGKRVRTIGALPSSRDQRSNERNAGLSGTRQDVGEIYEQTRQHFHSARDLMPSGEWDCIQILENGFDQIQGAGNASHDYYQHLDAELGKLLEVLDNATAILIVTACGMSSNFILAAPNNPLRGEIEGAHLSDMAPTLLELSGDTVPDSMQGKSLVAGKTSSTAQETGYTEDQEEIVRDRLKGLGYI